MKTPRRPKCNHVYCFSMYPGIESSPVQCCEMYRKSGRKLTCMRFDTPNRITWPGQEDSPDHIMPVRGLCRWLDINAFVRRRYLNRIPYTTFMPNAFVYIEYKVCNMLTAHVRLVSVFHTRWQIVCRRNVRALRGICTCKPSDSNARRAK